MTSPFTQTATESPGTGLAIPEIDAGVMFKPGGSTSFIRMVREHVAAQNLDISTDEGKDFVRSFAYKITRTKTEGVRRADALMEDAKKLIADVNSEKKFFVAEMEKIQRQVRDPLTLLENRDKERQGAHEQALGEIFDACMFIGAPTIQALKDRLAKIEDYSKRNWEEFAARATSALEQSRPALRAMLEKAEKAEADRLELEESRRKIKQLEDEANERKRQDDLAAARKEGATSVQKAAMPLIVDRGRNAAFDPFVISCEPITEEQRRQEIEASIFAALFEFVDDDQAADIVQAIKDGKIPHVQIVY